MCVVENDVWTYAVGEDQVLRGDDMPNPCLPVDALPWGDWQAPWERVLDDDDDAERSWNTEAERLTYWLFCVGMMLWEIEEGLHPATDITIYVPETRWLKWALRWVQEAEPDKPPPRHHHRKRASWKRRQLGVLCLETALLGMRNGLEAQRHEARQHELRRNEAQRERADQERDAEIMWS